MSRTHHLTQCLVLTAFLTQIRGLPQMRWDMSSCPEQDTRAEEREVIVVSRSYPTKIGQNWTCIYNFFTPSSNERIMIEFDDFLFEACNLQNLTITDKGTGRMVGPYCNEMMPPKFISDTSKVVVETHTGDLEHEANSRGYMFRFWRVTEAVALQEKQMATQNEFAQADYMDRMGGFGGQGGGMWGMGRGPGMMNNGPLQPGQGGGYPNYPNYGQPNAAPYPPGTPLGPPLAPDVLDTLPGGKTNYIQPGYGTQIYPDEETDEDDEGFTWTMPKVLGIAAGGLCVIALIAVAIQHHLRQTELKIAKEIAMAQRGGNDDSDSSTSFTSFDSEAEERERRRVKKQIKREKRQQRSDVNSIISDDDTKRKKRRRRKPVREEQPAIRTTKANFTQDDLKNATLELQKQKLQQKLQKYM